MDSFPHTQEGPQVLACLDEDEAPGEDGDYTGVSIENAYLEEKEDACTALADLAIHY